MNQYAFFFQSAQVIRIQNYDDEIYNIVSHHPRDAPNWTYVEQNTLANTDFSELEILIQMEKNLIITEDVEVSAEMDKIEVIKDSEPMEMKELLKMKQTNDINCTLIFV